MSPKQSRQDDPSLKCISHNDASPSHIRHVISDDIDGLPNTIQDSTTQRKDQMDHFDNDEEDLHYKNRKKPHLTPPRDDWQEQDQPWREQLKTPSNISSDDRTFLNIIRMDNEKEKEDKEKLKWDQE